MLIGGGKPFFLNFLPLKTAIFALFFKILSVFGAKYLQKYIISAPFKLFLTRILSKFSWPPIQAFPDTIMKPENHFLADFQIIF